jgi:hypothetical protein
MHARPHEIDARLINLIDKLAYGGDEKLMAAQTLLLRRLLASFRLDLSPAPLICQARDVFLFG